MARIFHILSLLRQIIAYIRHSPLHAWIAAQISRQSAPLSQALAAEAAWVWASASEWALSSKADGLIADTVAAYAKDTCA